ncbi:MAG: hypothetical protein F9K37_12040 [Bacteroidales bacterium]|nr:MAG: hypothetical protein F9K37_12040 [Bacteroidales bacterium]
MNNQFENMETQDLNTNKKFDGIDSLVINLKKEDLRNLNLMKSFKWIYLVMIIAYALLMVVNPDPDLKLHTRISGICYVVAFGIFMLIFRKYHKEYSEIDYTVPVLEMLSKAAKRYKFRWKSILICLPSIILIDIGVVLSDFFINPEIDWSSIVIFQLIYFGLMTTSGFVGYIIWRTRQKPLYDGAMQLLKELEGN